MGKETEVEIEVENLDEIEKQLKQSNALLIEKCQYLDIYFDKKKFYKNQRIRLRKKDIYFPEKKTCAIYTEKSPSIENGIQTADEYEKTVNFKDMFEKLKAKGIVCKFTLNITTYRLNNSRIDLRAGTVNYVEIEGQSKKDIETTMHTLKIKGKVLKEGALNKALKSKGMPKIKV